MKLECGRNNHNSVISAEATRLTDDAYALLCVSLHRTPEGNVPLYIVGVCMHKALWDAQQQIGSVPPQNDWFCCRTTRCIALATQMRKVYVALYPQDKFTLSKQLTDIAFIHSMQHMDCNDGRNANSGTLTP